MCAHVHVSDYKFYQEKEEEEEELSVMGQCMRIQRVIYLYICSNNSIHRNCEIIERKQQISFPVFLFVFFLVSFLVGV